MDRRKFIKNGCSACVAVVGMGLLMQGCASALPVVKSAAKNQSLSVPLSKFAELKTNMLLIRNTVFENDILVVKSEDAYKALLMKCSHEGFGLTATKSKLICTAHGSQFDFNGRVLREPALKPLTQFKISTENNNLLIHLN